MNFLGPSNLGMKYHIPRHGLKVSTILLSASVIEVRVQFIVGDPLSHYFAVMDERVVCKTSVVTVVVIHPCIEVSCMPLKTFLGVYSLLRGDIRHAVDILQV